VRKPVAAVAARRTAKNLMTLILHRCHHVVRCHGIARPRTADADDVTQPSYGVSSESAPVDEAAYRGRRSRRTSATIRKQRASAR